MALMTTSGPRMRAGRTIAAVAMIVGAGALSGCAEGGLAGSLRSAGVGDSPDEFLVLPTKPLEMPENLAALPPPTPGFANRVDPRPESDAVAALTGRPGAAGAASGGALIARAGPVDPQVRGQLAVEDASYRQGNRGRLLERIFGRDNPDWTTYENMRLDADAEFQRLRAQGVRVPAAPPLPN
jgi:hypothetical protein